MENVLEAKYQAVHNEMVSCARATRYAHSLQCPIYITENGCGYYDKLEEDGTIHDPYRVDIIKHTLNR